MSQRIDLRDIGIKEIPAWYLDSPAWYLDSPTMLGEFVAELPSTHQASFLDGLARGFENLGTRTTRLWLINAGVQDLGATRAKAVRDLVADLHHHLNEEVPPA